MRIGPSTDSDLHQVTFRGGVPIVYYVMWAGSHGYRYPSDAFERVLSALATACFNPSTTYPDPSHPHHASGGGDGGGGGGGGGAVGWVLFVLTVLAVGGVLGYGHHKGWEYPRTRSLAETALRHLRPERRSQTTPTPRFDSSSTHSATAPLATHDSATPYTPPPNPN